MTVTAKTTAGELRGREERGLVVFRGVRYAESARFEAPRPVGSWTGVRDATADGPIAPQLPSRLEAVMGAPEESEQAEDCLNLTVTTPGVDGTRPVLVWFHGGAFVTGAGSWDWYSGHRLANQGDVVVVGVNYRLGALGYLRAPGVSEGNLGLRDQIAALRWVRDNIAAFGGDPDAVTVAGQSAGAHAVACMLGIPEARRLFRRAIVQSVPLGIGLGDARKAKRSAERFLAFLDADPRTATVPEILDAQRRVATVSAGRLGLTIAPPFMPVSGTGVLPSWKDWQRTALAAADDLDVLIGTTALETAAFHTTNPVFRAVRRIPVLGPVLADAATWVAGATVFGRGTRALAFDLSRAGARVWAYRFDYAPEGSVFGACHCIELPFLFGDEQSWASAPMLDGADETRTRDLGVRLRASWLAFLHSGRPDTEDLVWPRFTAAAPTVHHWRD
ncbi:carboxylesterase/lipase family protein [Amycolatopsis sp. CA-230715]|uniref:carboxylesterase/lipase family protein n=1 Tax=Amycolatopsis sp. CA-230715 TaxID=2745196 RepID=UPI001C015A53|nr:carboxylesterase family protein [Amycolatopsis sp. CA-230715]QWF85110.1 Para-nitrobenzyl esterase [Amycolatopsis sp. CA-230715]